MAGVACRRDAGRGQVPAGNARHGVVRRGLAGAAWQAWRGYPSLGRAVMARLNRRGWAWQGKAGMATT